ncbi:helix-turn-helix domain-containing protein [Candidatus Enterococcus clewellii]|uniref:HTH cro/C1-type domain-containing protein n=1 Tax=Candidatus Enterococcus clewellii TaxID=1834193 RepID=A0A242K7V7_9ENTE|nr:helix-turn-helix transcriptional regulator [Enterococcus sp. 9E7_DIV0242]OTP17254.1 hypothetical protein A5888_001392 [Enterococcus sp. 9E7_DIV0242]
MSQDFIIQVRVSLAKHGKTPAWLAGKLGISRPYMSDIMNGKRSASPQIEPIKAVLKTLDKEENT